MTGLPCDANRTYDKDSCNFSSYVKAVRLTLDALACSVCFSAHVVSTLDLQLLKVPESSSGSNDVISGLMVRSTTGKPGCNKPPSNELLDLTEFFNASFAAPLKPMFL